MKNFTKSAGEGRKREKRYFYVLWKPENTVRVICERSYELMTLGLLFQLTGMAVPEPGLGKARAEGEPIRRAAKRK